MSQLFTEGTQHGEAIRIHAGWDRPLQTAYLSTIKDGEYDLSTMLDPGTAGHPFTFEGIQRYAEEQGIEASDLFWSTLKEHCDHQYGPVHQDV